MALFSDVFHGFMKKGTYILDSCPYCSEQYTARFIGNFAMFECPACNKAMTFEDFIKEMKHDILYEDALDNMNMPKSPEGLIDIANFIPDKKQMIVIPSGFEALDRMTGGFRGGELTILTGKRSEGKSTIAGQLAINCIQADHRVFFYSGELPAHGFQHWIFLQAAGREYINRYQDMFGENRYEIDHDYAEPHIRNWMTGKIILYDNRIVKTSEANTIIDRAKMAREFYGCDVIFVDNLKTARFKKDSDRDHFRKQANFAADMLAFANEYNCHVVLVAHPKKEDTGDANDNVSGLSDITDIAHNVITVQRLKQDQVAELGCDAVLDLSKNREHGKIGKIKMDFDEATKRFYAQNSNNIEHYNWEQEV